MYKKPIFFIKIKNTIKSIFLCIKYPFLYPRCVDDKPVFIIPRYSYYDDIPIGWRKRFGLDFCKELKVAILNSGGRKLMREFRIDDIKEKYGRFECYVNTYPEEVDRVIQKYGYISKFICINCGKDAVKKTVGWISPYCEDCLPPNRRWLWIDKIYDWELPKKKKENDEKREEWKK